MNLETIINNPLLKDIIVTIIILIASLLIIKWTSIFINNTGKRFEFDATLIQVINELIKYTVYALAVTLILNELGINITAIAVSLGIVGIAVGFAARDTISNFISGLFVLGDKSFKVGDIIEISDQKGKVTIMGFRVTKLVTPDNNIITIPNSNFSKNVFINHTLLEGKRVDLDVNIPYNIKVEDISESFKELTSGFKWALDVPKANVIINELSDTGIKATLSVWVDDPWKVVEYRSIIANKIGPLLVVNLETK
jgi:small conductance mechanosensitive channel